MTKTIKLFLTIFAVTGMLSACSSNSSKGGDSAADSSSATGSEATTGAGSDGSISDVAVDVDPLEGVSTVFYFEFDQSVLSSEARAALLVHAEVLSSNPASIRLEGHADERGSREYNMALGERRANAVRDFLVLQGVDATLIETVSFGEERPADSGSYEGAWSANRRVELK